jgi:hypothetical protein
MKRQKTSSSNPSSSLIIDNSLPPPTPAVPNTVAIPPQLRSIIQKEWAGINPNAPSATTTKEPIHVIVRSIEQAKENELKAYLTLCQVRLQIPSAAPQQQARWGSTSRPSA